MSNTTISPNMNMPVPVVGTDPGPDWANNINASLSIIDSHNHTSGQGVQITPQGLNINADLPLNGNNLTTARSLRFSPQSGTISGSSDLGCLYENGVDLYYIDGAGNQVRITQGGAVTGATGTITGLPSGTASAAFSGSTFSFQSATNTPATMNFGTVVLGQTVASGKNVTIAASGSQPSNYNLTLPTGLPSTQSALLSDNSGNLSFGRVTYSTYTPTISNVSSTPTGVGALGAFMYMCIGTNVQVAGIITYTANGSGGFGFDMTLPISRTDGNFTQQYYAAGNTSFDSTNNPQAGSVLANTSAQTVRVGVVTGGPVLGGRLCIQFMYSLVNF